MKVECIQFTSSTTGEHMPLNSWLTVGRTYTVLAVRAEPSREVSLRLVGDDGQTPGLYASTLFETVDARIPSSWIAQIDDTGVLQLAPREWLRPGYWEDYFNFQPSAVEEFDKVRKVLEQGA